MSEERDGPDHAVHPLKFRSRSQTLEQDTPQDAGVEARIAMTARCPDLPRLPRVDGAGQVQVLHDGSRTQLMHNGLRVVADGYEGGWMTRLIELCGGCHEPQEEIVFYEVTKRLPPSATMIELGGHWAFYSLWFQSLSEQRRSIVLEPDPKHLEVGRINAQLNHLDATFIHGCAGATPADHVLFKTQDSGEMELPRLTVPQLMEAHGIDLLNILHCDIQGPEWQVLQSCEELLRSGSIQFVFVSTHDFRISGDPLTHQRCLALIQDCGGVIIAEHDVNESYSGDGLIAAYFGSVQDKGAPVVISRNRYSESLFRNPLYDLAVSREHLEATQNLGDRWTGGGLRALARRIFRFFRRRSSRGPGEGEGS